MKKIIYLTTLFLICSNCILANLPTPNIYTPASFLKVTKRVTELQKRVAIIKSMLQKKPSFCFTNKYQYEPANSTTTNYKANTNETLLEPWLNLIKISNNPERLLTIRNNKIAVTDEAGKILKTFFKLPNGKSYLDKPVQLRKYNNDSFMVLDKGLKKIIQFDAKENILGEIKIKPNIPRFFEIKKNKVYIDLEDTPKTLEFTVK